MDNGFNDFQGPIFGSEEPGVKFIAEFGQMPDLIHDTLLLGNLKLHLPPALRARGRDVPSAYVPLREGDFFHYGRE